MNLTMLSNGDIYYKGELLGKAPTFSRLCDTGETCPIKTVIKVASLACSVTIHRLDLLVFTLELDKDIEVLKFVDSIETLAKGLLR